MSLQIPRLNDHYDRVAAIAEMETWLESCEPTDEELTAIGLEPAAYYALDRSGLALILEEEYARD